MTTVTLRNGFLVTAAFCAFLAGSVALLTTPALAADCSGIETAIVDCSNTGSTDESPVLSILVLGIQLLTGLVGIVAIGALIYAGILYSSASGNVQQTAKSKSIITNTLIALVLFAAMVAVLNWLIPGGLFGDAKFGAGGNGQGSITAKLITTKVTPPKNSSGGPETAPTDKNNNPATTLKLVIGSWNIYKFGSSNNAASGVKTLMTEVDALGLQEAQADVPKIASALGSGYSVYPTDKKDPRKVAIFWNNKKLSVISKGHFDGGYQPKYDLQREFVWIKFKDKTSGKVFYMINTHFPHHPYEKRSDGWYYTETSDGKAWQTHMKKLVEKVKSLQKENLPIFLTGDYNFSYRSDNCKQPLTPCIALSKNLSVKSGWEYTNLANVGSSQGTIDSSKAILDYVFSWDRSYITYQSMRVLHGGTGNGWSGSDHKPVGLSLTIGSQK